MPPSPENALTRLGPARAGGWEVHVTKRFRVVLASAFAVLAMLLFWTYADHVRSEADRVRAEVLERYGGEVVMLAVARDGLEPGDVVSSANVQMREWIN